MQRNLKEILPYTSQPCTLTQKLSEAHFKARYPAPPRSCHLIGSAASLVHLPEPGESFHELSRPGVADDERVVHVLVHAEACDGKRDDQGGPCRIDERE